MKHEIPHIPRWLRIFFYVSAGIFLILISFHYILNSKYIQQTALDMTARYLDLDINWDKMKYNGALAKFYGDNLHLNIPKANTTISLKEFSLAINPVSILFKKVHLISLEAEELKVNISAIPEKKEKTKSSKTDIGKLFNLFFVEKADFKKIQITAPGGKIVMVERIQTKAKTPFVFYSKAFQLNMNQLTYISPKIDLFLDSLNIKGSLDTEYSFTTGRTEPFFDGKILASNLIVAFRKKPAPWNPNPSWDDIITPFLEEKYPQDIPEDRSYLFLKKINVPAYTSRSRLQIKGGRFFLADGEIKISGLWDKRSSKIGIQLTTPGSAKMTLLPLGKSNFRQSFERFEIDLNAKGNLTTIKKGDIKGDLTVSLKGNRNVLKPENLILTSKPEFKDGLLSLPKFEIELGEGQISGKGKIDLSKKSLSSSFSGKKIDVQTVMRLFSRIDIPGKADLNGKIFGPLNNPSFDIDVSSEKARYEGITAGSVKGKLKISNKNLNLNLNSLLEGEGHGNFSLNIDEVFRSSIQTVKLNTSFKNMPAGPLLDTKVLTGRASGSFKMIKKQEDVKGSGQIDATNVNWYGIPIQRLSGKLNLKGKTLSIYPAHITWNSSEPSVSIPKPFVFNFIHEGYHFKGHVLPTLTAEGEFSAQDPDNLLMKLKATNTSLTFLSPTLPIEVEEAKISGTFSILYSLHTPLNSKVEANLSSFELLSDEKRFRLSSRTQVRFDGGKIFFQNTKLVMGNGQITLNGPLGINEGSDLKIRGLLDLQQLIGLQPVLAEGWGLADIDLSWQGSAFKPSLNGKIRFKNSSLLFRALGGEFTETNGLLALQGNQFRFDSIKTNYDDAPMTINGWIECPPPYNKFTAANLSLKGKEIPLSSPDTWRLLTDADVVLRGSGGGLQLKGTLNIVEGLFYKDYSLSQFVLKPVGVIYKKKGLLPEPFQNVRLDLNVKSSGEFEIQNNLAELVTRGNLQVSGSTNDPMLTGTIDVTEGQIHAFGIDFEDATGFATFRADKKLDPFIEFVASHDIGEYEVRALLSGYLSNLALKLESTPALSHNDVLSLIAYGQTPDQLSRGKQSLFSQAALASQLVGLLQRPLSKATRLDILRVESDPTQKTPTVSRFSIGKRLSDRFSLAFTTDLSLDEASKGAVIEYLIYDNLLLKGTKDTGSRYRFDLTWRIQGY